MCGSSSSSLTRGRGTRSCPPFSNVSQIFVAPFEGILRTDALTKGGSILDVTAIVALVGWTILELVLIWAIGIFRDRSAGTAA